MVRSGPGGILCSLRDRAGSNAKLVSNEVDFVEVDFAMKLSAVVIALCFSASLTSASPFNFVHRYMTFFRIMPLFENSEVSFHAVTSEWPPAESDALL